MSIAPGTQVGRFRIARLLAQGGMAEVYRADQEVTAGFFRPVALKVIRPEFAESADFREMFLDEARTACTLSHPNIVHIYEVGESEGRLYMAMELVAGETLAQVANRLADGGERLSNEALLAVGLFTCSALEAVHALRLPGEGHLNLVHRDVSPHNLLLSPSGTLNLIDFGIAKAVTNRNLTLPGITKGKAGYFSPEQAMGKSLDGRSDLFSLGVTLYKLASGGTPLEDYQTHYSRNMALIQGKWLPLSKVCPDLPLGLYTVIQKAMSIPRELRFASAREMREALERAALESGVHVGTGSLMGYVADPEVPGEQLRHGVPLKAGPAPGEGSQPGRATVRKPTTKTELDTGLLRQVVGNPWPRIAAVVFGALAVVGAVVALVGQDPSADRSEAPPPAPQAVAPPMPLRPVEPPAVAGEPAKAEVSPSEAKPTRPGPEEKKRPLVATVPPKREVSAPRPGSGTLRARAFKREGEAPLAATFRWGEATFGDGEVTSVATGRHDLAVLVDGRVIGTCPQITVSPGESRRVLFFQETKSCR